MLLVKKCQFFVYVYLVKIRLQIMLNDFAEKNRIFQSLNNRTLPKGITYAFGQKMPIFWLFRFGQNVVSALFAIQVLLSEDFRLYDQEIYSVHHRKRPHSCSTEGSFHKKFCKMNTWLDSLSSTQLSGKSNSQ